MSPINLVYHTKSKWQNKKTPKAFGVGVLAVAVEMLRQAYYHKRSKWSYLREKEFVAGGIEPLNLTIYLLVKVRLASMELVCFCFDVYFSSPPTPSCVQRAHLHYIIYGIISNMNYMKDKTTQPASITLCVNGQTYSVDNINWDANANELLEQFQRLMVAAGYPPSILDDEEGSWVYQDKSSNE